MALPKKVLTPTHERYLQKFQYKEALSSVLKVCHTEGCREKWEGLCITKVYLTSPGPSEIGHNSFISNTSGLLVGFRVW